MRVLRNAGRRRSEGKRGWTEREERREAAGRQQRERKWKERGSRREGKVQGRRERMEEKEKGKRGKLKKGRVEMKTGEEYRIIEGGMLARKRGRRKKEAGKRM